MILLFPTLILFDFWKLLLSQDFVSHCLFIFKLCLCDDRAISDKFTHAAGRNDSLGEIREFHVGFKISEKYQGILLNA